MIQSSDMLLNFYKAWLSGRDFVRSDFNGLCVNLGEWVWKNHFRDDFDMEEEDAFWDLRESLVKEMKSQFKVAGLDVFYPFNTSYANYVEEASKNLCFANPLRVQWVSDRIADMEKSHENT